MNANKENCYNLSVGRDRLGERVFFFLCERRVILLSFKKNAK